MPIRHDAEPPCKEGKDEQRAAIHLRYRGKSKVADGDNVTIADRQEGDAAEIKRIHEVGDPYPATNQIR